MKQIEKDDLSFLDNKNVNRRSHGFGVRKLDLEFLSLLCLIVY